jgi:WD40 repeat protein
MSGSAKKSLFSTQSFSKTLLLIFFLSWIVGGCDLRDKVFQASPTPPALPAPTDTAVQLPDLVIASMSVIGNAAGVCPTAGESYQVQVSVINRGNAPAGPFVVRFNVDQQLVSAGLQPGKTVALFFPYSDASANVMVDATSLVLESDESNNQLDQRLDLPTPLPACIATTTPEIRSVEAKAILTGHKGKVWDVAFSPDGKTIASGSVDDTLRLWSVDPPRLVRTMQGHPFPVLKVKFSPNGAWLATGSMDGIVRFWQVSNGMLLETLEGHTGWITGLDISPDARWLASSAQDETVRLWRLPGAAVVQVIDEGMSGVEGVAFSPDSSMLAWGEIDGTIRLRTMAGKWMEKMQGGYLPVKSVAFSPDGRYLASGSEDGIVRVWLIADGTLVQSLRGHSQAINDLAFSPDGGWLVSASQDGTLRLWQFVEEKFNTLPSTIFVGHTGPVTSVAFSPKGSVIASGSEDGTIRLWEVP